MRRWLTAWTLVTTCWTATVSAALVETIAGGGIGDGLPATLAPASATGVAVAANGDVYLSDGLNARVRRVDAATGLVSTAVGGGTLPGCPREGGATAVCLGQPHGLAFDPQGRLLIADRVGVLRWDPATGMVTTVAGDPDPVRCEPADGVPAREACLAPTDVVVDASGTIFVVSPDARQVHRIDPVNGLIDAYAGRPVYDGSVCGEGGPALLACLAYPNGLALDAAGNVLITSAQAGRLWRVERATGVLTRVAGHGDAGTCGDPGNGGLAANACVFPSDVVADAAGNLLLHDGQYGQGLRRIDGTTGVVTLLGAGGGVRLALDAAANVFAASGDVTRRDASTGVVTTVAGNGTSDHCGDGLPATEACLSHARALAYDPAGNLFIREDTRIRRVDAATGLISTFVAGGPCDDATVEPVAACVQGASSFTMRPGLVADAAGNLLLSTTIGNEDDGVRHIVQRIDHATRAVSTFAGRCTRPESAGIPAVDTCLEAAGGLVLAPDGDLLLADRTRVRRVDAQTGEISVVAGSGVDGCALATGEGGPAVAACLSAWDVALDGDGNVFVASLSMFDSRVWRVDAATQTIRTVVAGGPAARVLDGQPATAGAVHYIEAIAADVAGNLLIAASHRIRLVEPAGGTIVTIAGVPPALDGPDPCFLGGFEDTRCLGALDLVTDAAGRIVVGQSTRRLVSRLTLLCGNGTLDPAEACDDGNFVSGDGCDAVCAVTACGNGVLTSGEACDDGNTGAGDCCSATCALDPPAVACDDGNPCTPGDRCTATGSCLGGGIESCGLAGPCAAPYCDDLTGECALDVAPDRTSCALPDGVAHGWCVDGACVTAESPACGDGDACTLDVLDPSAGCVNGAPAMACACKTGIAVDACPGRTSRAVRRAFARACRHHARLTRRAGPSVRLEALVTRDLERTMRRITRAARKGRLAPPCTEALLNRLDRLVLWAGRPSSAPPS